MLKYILFIIIGYLNGSFLFGYIIPKLFFHVDTIKNSDDNNPGTANSFKIGGILCGIIVVIFELTKGFLPIFIARRFVSENSLMFSLVLVAPVIGHAYPIYSGFKNGGKCIAVSFGCLLGLFPYMRYAYTLAFWYLFFSIIVIVNPNSFRSVITYICWMITILFFPKFLPLLIGNITVGIIVILRHLKSVKQQMDMREINLIFRRG